MRTDYTNRRFGWLLLDVVPLAEPIPWKGKQGWFHVPDALFPDDARRLPKVPAPGVQTAWPFPVSAHGGPPC